VKTIFSRVGAALANRSVLACVAVASLAAAAGCVAEYQRTDVDGVVESPLGGSVNYASVSVPEGMVVKAHIAPFNDDNNPLTCVLSSEDATIMDVSQAVGDKDYAFYGLKPGTTRINVRAGDAVVMVLDAVVTAQPPTTP
jgi:hypothetical protein